MKERGRTDHTIAMLSVHTHLRGVSIAELAIVIAVIALLMGVITGGYTIKKASEIRGVITDVQQFQSANENFQQAYKALPGDMPDATRYWGVTQNGDGNGVVDYAQTGNNESLRAWQHLNLAGFVEGGYTGTATVTEQADIAINIPASKRTKVGYLLVTGNLVGADARLELRAGGFHALHANDAGAFTASEAKSLDAKIDDGHPNTGTVLGAKGSNIPSELCQSGSGAEYRVSGDGNVCIVGFSAFP